MSTSSSTSSASARKPRQVLANLARRLAKTCSDYQELLEEIKHTTNVPDFTQPTVEDALAARASDIHLEPQDHEVRVRFRIDGLVSDVASLSVGQGRWLINQFKALANVDPIVQFTPRDSHARLVLDEGTVDMRLASVPCQQGEAISIRLLDPRQLERSIHDLGLTPDNLRLLEEWLGDTNGMFLCAGPTGAGKTTTVYALLHELKFAERTIVSIEDPVEYEVPGIVQVQLDEKHQLSFAEGVRAMMRLDPDFLMIGEIRDAVSAHAAVSAAITGRALLSTIHARDTVGVITALRNWRLADHEIAESLTVVVAQRLVRRLCLECRKLAAPTEVEKRWLESFRLPIPDRAWAATGCKKCNEVGYVGRTAVFELWRLREDDYRLIIGHADERALRRHFREGNRASLLEEAMAKVTSGTTSLAEVRRAISGTLPYEASAPQGA